MRSHFIELFILLFCVSNEKNLYKIATFKDFNIKIGPIIIIIIILIIIILVSGHLRVKRCHLSYNNLADAVPVK